MRHFVSFLCLASVCALGTRGADAPDGGYRFAPLAGQPSLGSVNGRGAEASFAYPHHVAMDREGNAYITEPQSNTVRKITPDGVVTTLAGATGVAEAVDGGLREARFILPIGIARDAAGNLYVSDGLDHTIRKIDPLGIVVTLAGRHGSPGDTNGTGEEARFSTPSGLAIDRAGNIIVADSGNHAIRRVTPAGVVTTIFRSGEKPSTNSAVSEKDLYLPISVAVDPVTNVIYVIDYVQDNIRRITADGQLAGVAGTVGNSGFADGRGADARFSIPLAMAVDRSGTLYVADSFNNAIRRITLDGEVKTVAGRPEARGYSDGALNNAIFNRPAGLGVDEAGNIVVADTGNHFMRRIEPAANRVITLAGTGSAGFDDGAGARAHFRFPDGMAVDPAGNVFVADSGNRMIRKITPAGVVSTIVGSAAGSPLGFPTSLAVDRAGTLYVSDTTENVIRKLSPDGTLTVLAGARLQVGGNDGQGAAARFSSPRGLALAPDGTLYVADEENATIRKITPAGLVTTIAGRAGEQGSADGPGRDARFTRPSGLALDADGSLYVADPGALTIRRITPAGVVSTLAGRHLQRGIADGRGGGARFNLPRGIAIDRLGTLFVADGNNTIRRVAPDGTVSTLVARSDIFDRFDQEPGVRLFYFTTNVATDFAGNLYVSDADNNTVRKAVSTTRLVNLSVRAYVGANEQAPILGFVLSGAAKKFIVTRAVGATLSAFGVPGAVPDTRLTLNDQSGAVLSQNDNWGGGSLLTEAFKVVGAFPLPMASSDAALLANLDAGVYSARTTAAGDTGGIALAEVYDADRGSSTRLVNASIRAFTDVGGAPLTVGFVLSGTAPKTLLIRAAGPSLARQGVSGTAADPRITVSQDTTAIASNDNWGGAPELKAAGRGAGAFDFESDGSRDAAVLPLLPPGVYTVQINTTGGAGLTLLEIYEAP